MDHDHDHQTLPEFTAGGITPFPAIPSVPLASELPFYIHQRVQNYTTPVTPPPTNPLSNSTITLGPCQNNTHHVSSSTDPSGLNSNILKGGEIGWDNLYGGNGGGIQYNTSTTSTVATPRWPRQETLTLLEIRSRLHHSFKEAIHSNYKASLWDQVSRIMKEEYGYQRSGRKCKEKFENLYKYYKKTKEGKVGKQDGKHYRFFRQLEALYGNQPSNQVSNSNYAHLTNTNILYPSTLSNSSEFATPSQENNDYCDLSGKAFTVEPLPEKKKISSKRERKGWIARMEDSIELYIEKLMEKQDAWGKRMLSSIENKEQERIVREEKWRKQETARCDQEYELWANEIARIEARDTALLEFLGKFNRKKSIGSLPNQELGGSSASKESNVRSLITASSEAISLLPNMELMIMKENGCIDHNNIENSNDWLESEISSLIQIRASMEGKFQENGHLGESNLWEEVATKLAFLGYDRNELNCKEMWEKIFMHYKKTILECKKNKKDSRIMTSFLQNFDSENDQEFVKQDPDDNAENALLFGSCSNTLMNIEGERLCENSDIEFNKDNRQQD